MEQTRYIDLYVDEVRDNLDALSAQLVQLEQDPEGRIELLDEIMRLAHTCKSSSSIMQFENVADLFEALEDIFDTARKEKLVLKQQTIDLVFQSLDWAIHAVNSIEVTGKEPKDLPILEPLQQWKDRKEGIDDELIDVLREERRPLDVSTISSIRVNVRHLDYMVDVAKQLSQLHGEMSKHCQEADFKQCEPLLEHLDDLVSSLTEQLHRCRLVPVGQIVLNFPKLVRDLAQEQGKVIDFSVFSSVSHLDKSLAERIQGPIIHLLRNAVDHGIETLQDREKAGKPEVGLIALRIERTEEAIRVILEDDGKPIDVERVKELAKSKGFQDEWLQSINENNIIELLSNPHFSSSSTVTSVSGRGVGLSAVRNSVESFAGTLHLDLSNGRKRFILTVPAQLSVIESLLIEAKDTIYAVPEAYVERLRQAENANIVDEAGVTKVNFDDASMPIVWLHDIIGESPRLSTVEDFAPHTEVVTIILRIQNQKIALAIDQLLMRDTIMIKPMSIGVLNNPLISGPTTLPSGTEVHLLGVPDLMRAVKQLTM